MRRNDWSLAFLFWNKTLEESLEALKMAATTVPDQKVVDVVGESYFIPMATNEGCLVAATNLGWIVHFHSAVASELKL